MSMADTAEYQLSQLAGAMTEALQEVEDSPSSRDYKSGFRDAMEAIAGAMGLKTVTSYKYP